MKIHIIYYFAITGLLNQILLKFPGLDFLLPWKIDVIRFFFLNLAQQITVREVGVLTVIENHLLRPIATTTTKA